jgi:hypothetical protein
MSVDWTLELEIEELEAGGKPGCNSSSTHPRCTCPIITPEEAPQD